MKRTDTILVWNETAKNLNRSTGNDVQAFSACTVTPCNGCLRKNGTDILRKTVFPETEDATCKNRLLRSGKRNSPVSDAFDQHAQ